MSTARVLSEYANEPTLDENTAISELWLEYLAVRQEFADYTAELEPTNEDV